MVFLLACATKQAPDAAEPSQSARAETQPAQAEAAQPTQRTAVASSMYYPQPGQPMWPPMISGKQAIIPDEPTIERASVEYARLMSSWKVCIDETGAVNIVEKLRSSGFPDYDATIRRELSQWKYQPLKVDGKAMAACKAVTLVYDLPSSS
jgi:hypothetical protein